MMQLLLAEWQKAYRNKYLFGLTAGLFPLGTLVMFGLFTLVLLLDPGAVGEGEEALWWPLMEIAFAVPSMFIGQIFLMGFAASIFAGESAWNTWKSIIPRTQRLKLIVTKYVLFTLVIFGSFNLMGLIVILGTMLLGALAGTGYAPLVFSADALAYTDQYLLLLLTTMLNLMIAAGYAGIASIFTRSVLGSAVAASVISIGENASLALFLFLRSLFETNVFLEVYQLLPGYNIFNLQSWLLSGDGVYAAGELAPNSPVMSLLLIGGWLVLLVSVTVVSFYRRDIA